MPVRSLHSPVLRWPDASLVHAAFCAWAERTVSRRGDIRRMGYFGSYAAGNWGVGSDLDVLIVLDHSDLPFDRRAVEWHTTELPVPVDLLVYTDGEWSALAHADGPTLFRPTVRWVYPSPTGGPSAQL